MAASDSQLTFPHAELSPIVGEPTNTSLQLLRRQLYANARSIDSTRGGGNNGHLAILMSDAAYLARAGVAFVIPAHPGAAPVHAPAATAAQIAETIRLFNQDLADHTLYNKVATALKAQLLQAVDATYLSALEDPEFGYADVTARAMLAHLQTRYGTLTPEAVETNRNALSTPWNPDEPIETLWKRIAEIRRVAAAGNEPITEVTAITLTVAMIEKTGLLSDATKAWRLRPLAEWTLQNFQTDFDRANKERHRQLTASAAGYQGAHLATSTITPVSTPTRSSVATATTPIPPASTPPNYRVQTEGDKKLYYCWTHGLGSSAEHTSATCEHKAEGHKDDATVFNPKGGSSRIALSAHRRPSNNRQPRN